MTRELPYNPQPPRPPWGIRFPARKEQSTHQPIKRTPLPAEVALPLACGPAGLADCIAKPGDRVRTGQLIARTTTGVCVHATISGKVTSVEESAVAGGREACIHIKSDGRDEWIVPQTPIDALALSPQQICERIAASGIVGLGGALYPTADKLSVRRPISALLLNGAECEPYISCDEMLLREQPERVIAGARIMMRALSAPHAIIAIETDMPEARATLADLLADQGITDISVAVVTAKYPAGGERQLLELLTGTEVPTSGLPEDMGYVCQNVATAAAVADFFATGRPMVERIVTVTGNGVSQAANYVTRLGSSFRSVIEAAGGYNTDSVRLLMGGPMMGLHVADDQVPVTKATNCIVVAHPTELASPATEFPCIRCGECSDACPARLMPQFLLTACRAGDTDALTTLGVDACIECGCCDFACPSHINLTPLFVEGKAALAAKRLADSRAAAARARSELRDVRLEVGSASAFEDSDPQAPADDLSALLTRSGINNEQVRDAD